jgi:hypothetical protein
MLKQSSAKLRRRLGHVEDIARGVVFLTADDANLIAWSSLSVHAGQYVYLLRWGHPGLTKLRRAEKLRYPVAVAGQGRPNNDRHNRWLPVRPGPLYREWRPRFQWSVSLPQLSAFHGLSL